MRFHQNSELEKKNIYKLQKNTEMLNGVNNLLKKTIKIPPFQSNILSVLYCSVLDLEFHFANCI